MSQNIQNLATLADIIRTLTVANPTRNQLKVARARLRRLGLTNLNKGQKGPYAINVASDAATDRAVEGTVIAGVVADGYKGVGNIATL